MSSGKLFRFEDMEIWKRAMSIACTLFRISEKLDQRRYYRFAEQLRAAALSISNNISEGSGSGSARDFAHFLNISRRSVFETANMTMVFCEMGIIEKGSRDAILRELEEEAKMLTAFIRTLRARS